MLVEVSHLAAACNSCHEVSFNEPVGLRPLSVFMVVQCQPSVPDKHFLKYGQSITLMKRFLWMLGLKSCQSGCAAIQESGGSSHFLLGSRPERRGCMIVWGGRVLLCLGRMTVRGGRFLPCLGRMTVRGGRIVWVVGRIHLVCVVFGFRLKLLPTDEILAAKVAQLTLH